MDDNAFPVCSWCFIACQRYSPGPQSSPAHCEFLFSPVLFLYWNLHFKRTGHARPKATRSTAFPIAGPVSPLERRCFDVPGPSTVFAPGSEETYLKHSYPLKDVTEKGAHIKAQEPWLIWFSAAISLRLVPYPPRLKELVKARLKKKKRTGAKASTTFFLERVWLGSDTGNELI